MYNLITLDYFTTKFLSLVIIYWENSLVGFGCCLLIAPCKLKKNLRSLLSFLNYDWLSLSLSQPKGQKLKITSSLLHFGEFFPASFFLLSFFFVHEHWEVVCWTKEGFENSKRGIIRERHCEACSLPSFHAPLIAQWPIFAQK